MRQKYNWVLDEKVKSPNDYHETPGAVTEKKWTTRMCAPLK